MIRLRRAAVMLSLAAALTVSGRASAATTYYVGSNGDDTAPGTSAEQPWRTPARVKSVDLAPGDRVLFQGGAAFSGGVELDAGDAGTESAPVIVGSYGDGRATLRPGNQPGGYAEDMGGLVVRDLRLEGPGMDRSATDGLTVYASRPWGARFPPVRVERVEATGFGRSGVSIGSWA